MTRDPLKTRVGVLRGCPSGQHTCRRRFSSTTEPGLGACRYKTAEGQRNFLNADPAAFSGSLNFYAYAYGNPMSLMDPFGLCASEAAWVSQFAGWLDRNVTSPLNSVSTTSTLANWAAYNADSLVGGFADWFRLGEGAAFATCGAQDGWDVALELPATWAARREYR